MLKIAKITNCREFLEFTRFRGNDLSTPRPEFRFPGLKPGDYLASYDGNRLESLDDLRRVLQAAAGSGRQEVALVIYRGAERLELTIAPGRMGVNLAER